MDDTTSDLEGAALAIYGEAGLDPTDPPSAHDLARAILGRHGVQYAHGILGGAKYQPLPDGREWIFVRPGLPPVVEQMKIFHELAERHLRRSFDPHLEVLCDQIAYRLRMPRPAFLELVRTVGPNWRRLAAPWGASDAAGALRYLEATGTPGVVITRTAVRARGEAWAWPDEQELRRLVRARALPDGLERRRLRDGAGVVFTAV